MRLLLSCVMVLALAFPAMAAQGGFQGPGQAPGGFQGPTSGVQADTVANEFGLLTDTHKFVGKTGFGYYVDRCII